MQTRPNATLYSGMVGLFEAETILYVYWEVVDAVDVSVGGRSGPNPKPAITLLEDAPCEILLDVLSGILPYHSREKMYWTKAKPKRKTLPWAIAQPARNVSVNLRTIVGGV